ncbi:GPI mannosyltransferase 1 [Cyclospora cayetanensis]|uniref:GPI mannosyltransferase 1 n=1 Tax=Cyclospora cayetanensis TaxID=88456 RepID=A0A6P6RWD6_9EIME|nr:GPI mannosyltransferase 1 [Cyclospora cayetanensis]
MRIVSDPYAEFRPPTVFFPKTGCSCGRIVASACTRARCVGGVCVKGGGSWVCEHAAVEVKFTDIDYKVYTDAANHQLSKQHQQQLPPRDSRTISTAYVSAALLLLAVPPGSCCCKRQRYGLSVHVKLYPVIYGVPMLLYLQQGKELPEGLLKVPSFPKERLLQVVWGVFSAPVAAAMLPFRVCCFLLRRMDRWQWSFGLLSCAACLAIGSVFYFIYGFPFVYESYLYHATRSDHRHNLSLYFYLLYLDSSAPLKVRLGGHLFRLPAAGLSVALLLPQLVGTLLVGCFFAKKHLEAALCLQTIAFVALNKVCTSQYFLWWLCLLPFAVASTDMSRKTVRDVVVAIVFFQLSCFLWLFFAYKLEFEGHPVFLQLMLASVVFFASQMHLVTLVCSRIRANDKAVKY